MKFRDLSGHEFGLLSVTSQFERRLCTNRYRFYWLCNCKCGEQTWVSTSDLVTGHARSCGCQKVKDFRERVLESKPWLKCPNAGNTYGFKHGKSRTKVYSAWSSMLRRCKDTKHPFAKHYIGRGITVCPEWRDFTAFYAHVGDPPTPKHTIDRINNNGNYEPGNVRWATRYEQIHNRSSNIK